jgi:hypothetical protein
MSHMTQSRSAAFAYYVPHIVQQGGSKAARERAFKADGSVGPPPDYNDEYRRFRSLYGIGHAAVSRPSSGEIRRYGSRCRKEFHPAESPRHASASVGGAPPAETVRSRRRVGAPGGPLSNNHKACQQEPETS